VPRPTIDDLGGVVVEVLEEVHATTPVRLSWRPGWGALAEQPGSVGGVVHLAGVEPSPHWVEPMDDRVSAPVEWHLGRGDDPRDPPETRVETLGQVADAVQDLVQVELWRCGLDPTWPPCPAHPDAHPLQPGWNDLAGHWTCRSGAALVPLGRLLHGDGLLRGRPLPSPGPGAVDALVDLVLGDLRRTSDVEPAFDLDAGLRVEVEAEAPAVGMQLWRIAHAVADLVRTTQPEWPPCPDHPGAHRLAVQDSCGNSDDTVLWRCPEGPPVAFVGELGLVGG
jgi:hypothetical protein